MLTKSDLKILIPILCWVALLITLSYLTLSGAFGKPYEHGYRCVYIFEDLNESVLEATRCDDRTCRVDDTRYAYKWYRMECGK